MKKRNQLTFLSCYKLRGVRDALYMKAIASKTSFIFNTDVRPMRISGHVLFELLETKNFKEKLCLG